MSEESVNACAHVSEASSFPPWAWVRHDRILGGQESGGKHGCVNISERVGAACLAAWASPLLLVAAASLVTTQPVGTYHGDGKHAHERAHMHVHVHVHSDKLRSTSTRTALFR